MFSVTIPQQLYVKSRLIRCDPFLRMLSDENKPRPPWRRKTTQIYGKPPVHEQRPLSKDAIEASDILKCFLPRAPIIPEVPSSRKKSEDVIKASDLLKDFIGKTITHTQSRNRPDFAKKQSFARHTESLPCPETFPFTNLSSKKHVPAKYSEEDKSTKDAFLYKNDVYNEVMALEAQTYRSKASNRFEELLLWTLEGKLWQYPIDNEQGWDSEKATGFHEHVFLERFINRKAEKPAPLAAFMELICAGLAQNPHIDTKQKLEHIQWFEKYFSTKISQIESAVTEENRISVLEKKHKTA